MGWMDIHLPAVIELDGRHLLVRLEDGQSLRLSREDAAGLAEGDRVVVQVLPEEQDTLGRQELARALLAELMKADD